MKTDLNKILLHSDLKAVTDIQHSAAGPLVLHSKEVEEGAIYVAIKGTVADGHDYIDQAVEQGAKVVFIEKELTTYHEGVDYYLSAHLRAELGLLAANYYDHPSREMKVVGVTGTNGKTTITTLLYQLFTALGHQVGLISTIEHYIGKRTVTSTHTTPNPIVLQSLFADMLAEGCSHVFMEVSSHAIDQDRIVGIDFDGAVFTNISHDHLDYHGTFANYIEAKKKFFDGLSPHAFAISNRDDKRGLVMLQNTKAIKKLYGLQHVVDYKGVVLENEGAGLYMEVDGYEVHFMLNGLFNAYNLLSVYAVAVELGYGKDEILTHLSLLKGAAGRFETLFAPEMNIRVIIDYAHTPDALLNVLTTIEQMNTQGGEVITVVGCGGDRDKTKRPLMRKVSTEYSHKVILTSDNPRTEDPQVILDDMMEGASADEKRKITQIVDRKEAIKLAVQWAKPNDVILVAGKGHETYQEANGVRKHFDDKEEALTAFQLMNIK